MAEKVLQTRILLKYDSYENWEAIKDTFVPRKGEVCFVEVPAKTTGVTQHAPAVLFKVGDGTSVFSALQWGSAKAADVYDWAKAEKKPVYNASEITGIDTYISEYVNEEMGISVDTDTQYTLVKGDNDYEVKLMSKSKLDTEYTTEVAKFTVPKYDDTALAGRVEAVEKLVGNTAVATQIGNAIDALKTELATVYEPIGAEARAKEAVIGAEGDAASADTIYGAKKYADTAVATAKGQIEGTAADTSDLKTIAGAKKYAEEKAATAKSEAIAAAATDAQSKADAAQAAAIAEANKKVASVAAADKSVVVAGTTTAPTVGVQISGVAGNALELAEDGLKVVMPAATDYTVTVTESSPEGYAKAYTIAQAATGLSTTINIPKDMVVQSGAVEVKAEAGDWGQAGTYLVLTLANATSDKVYINVGDLIEYVTSGSTAEDQIQIAVSADHKVTATLKEGSVTKAQLVPEVQTSLGKADSALQKADIVTGTAQGTIAVGGSDVEVNGLGSAAFVETTAFDAAGAASTAKAEVIGQEGDASTVDTIKGTKKYADEKAAAVAGDLATLTGRVTQAETDIDTNTAAIATAESNAKAHAEAKVKELADGAVATNTKGVADNKAAIEAEAQTARAAEQANAAAAKAADDKATQAQNEVDALELEVAKKANDADLAAIAKSGKASDLIQTEGEYLVFDCGSATKNIVNA